jgi:Na+/H+-dicarboxylate symporter
MFQRYFTLIVLAAMALGMGAGYALNANLGDITATLLGQGAGGREAIFDANGAILKAKLAEIADNFSLITDIFLRLIKMIIAPLVLSTLVVGIAHMGGTGGLGRVGVRTLVWFILASIVSLCLGLALVHVLQPGVDTGLTLPPADADSGIQAAAVNLKDFITHLVPKSIFEAMANNEILPIVVFSVFFGAALAALGAQAKPVVDLAEQVSHVMLRVTGYVMMFAPFAVFAAIAATVTENGLAILGTYLKFIGGFYVALVILWAVLLLAGLVFVGARVFSLLGYIREPILLAFSTASSEAAYPRTFEQLQRFGASRRIAGFVLPLGYSFNLDGSMMYCTFAVMFIAQLYGVPLSIDQQLTMLLLLMVTSKGMAGVPRASLVVIAATLAQFNLPEAGLVLILAVDHFLDMGRSATNVVGNSIATLVVARWEKELGPPRTSIDPGSGPPLEAAGDIEIGR